MTARSRNSKNWWIAVPNDPAAVNHLLTATLMRELYRMGAMNSGEYANDSFIGRPIAPLTPR